MKLTKLETEIIEDAIKYAKRISGQKDSMQDFSHTMRVYRVASYIAEREHANLFVVQLAALLHNTETLSKDAPANEGTVQFFLKSHGLSDEICEVVCSIICEVSRCENDSGRLTSIEGKCVWDADQIDDAEKIFALQDVVNTNTAKATTKHREQYMRDFMKKLMEEEEK